MCTLSVRGQEETGEMQILQATLSTAGQTKILTDLIDSVLLVRMKSGQGCPTWVVDLASQRRDRGGPNGQGKKNQNAERQYLFDRLWEPAESLEARWREAANGNWGQSGTERRRITVNATHNAEAPTAANTFSSGTTYATNRHSLCPRAESRPT